MVFYGTDFEVRMSLNIATKTTEGLLAVILASVRFVCAGNQFIVQWTNVRLHEDVQGKFKFILFLCHFGNHTKKGPSGIAQREENSY